MGKNHFWQCQNFRRHSSNCIIHIMHLKYKNEINVSLEILMFANYILYLVRYFVIWLCISLYCLNFYFSIWSSLCVFFHFSVFVGYSYLPLRYLKMKLKKNIFLVKQLVIKHYLFLNCNFITFFQTYRN